MRELFVLDKKNYVPNGSVGRRPSVRGIIIKDGKIVATGTMEEVKGDKSLEDVFLDLENHD